MGRSMVLGMLGGVLVLTGLSFMYRWGLHWLMLYPRPVAPWHQPAFAFRIWLLYRIAPGIPLGVFTGGAYALWQRGERRKAAHVCFWAGLLAVPVLTFMASTLSAFSVIFYLQMFIATYNWRTLMYALMPYICYGALQWALLLFLAGCAMKWRLFRAARQDTAR